MQLFSDSDFRTATDAAMGLCVTAASIKKVERAITNAYVKRGYITSRAFSSRATGDAEQVVINVVEGRVDKVAPGDGAGDGSGNGASGQQYSPNTLRAAFGRLKDKRLNIRRLEQGIDQLARLPSGNPTIDIVPSDTAGRSDLVVNRNRVAGRLRPSLAISNGGSRSTGTEIATLSVESDNLLGQADYLSIYVQHDIASGAQSKSLGAGAFLTVPYGPNLLSLSGNYSEYNSILASNGLLFSNDGSSFSGSVSLDRLLYRDARHKLSASARLSLIDTQTHIQDIRLSVSSYRLVTLTLGAALQSRIGAGHFSTNIAFVQGIPIFGAEAADFGPGGPTVRSSKLEGGVSAQAPFRLVGIPLSYGLSVTGQYGFSPLLAAERISIGGEHSVRGYFESGAGGDHGIIARTQIGVPLFTTFKEPKTGRGTRFSAIVGHDAGWVWDPASGPNATLLHAANLGLSLSNRRLSGRVTIAKALSSLFGTRPARPELLATLNLSI